MGQPIILPDGRIAYGQAQAAVMLAALPLPLPLPLRQAQGAAPVPELVEGQGAAGSSVGSVGELAEPVEPVEPVEGVEGDDFTVVSGINVEIQAALQSAGFRTWEDIFLAGSVRVQDEVSGVGKARARALFKRAIEEA